MIARRLQAGLRPDPARVVARLFLPGEELHRTHSRASQVVGRVMRLAEDEVEGLAAGLLRDFGGRHYEYEALLRRHASIVSAHIEQARELTAARTLLTSPWTITLTSPPSSLITALASSTCAAFSMASVALIKPTRPWVSIRPRA